MSNPSDELTAQLQRIKTGLDDVVRQNDDVIRDCTTAIQDDPAVVAALEAPAEAPTIEPKVEGPRPVTPP
jgi:hypothetical protein